MTQTTARFVRQLEGWQSDARLYELSEPMRVGWLDNWDDEGPDERPWTYYVIVSAGTPYGYPETLTFAADSYGNVLSWHDGPGSHRGSCDHAQAIEYAGWVLA